eukprot:scaffold2069_cov254-Pinguiococcus_pyrenoidosus.AAC.31
MFSRRSSSSKARRSGFTNGTGGKSYTNTEKPPHSSSDCASPLVMANSATRTPQLRPRDMLAELSASGGAASGLWTERKVERERERERERSLCAQKTYWGTVLYW